MKAIVYTKYGPPSVLELKEVEKPTPKDNEVLVKVHASTITPIDWHFLTGTPYVARILAGLFKPRNNVLGTDVAGRVEAIGAGVKHFTAGDEVIGGKSSGGYAEFATVPKADLYLKPAELSFEEAAAVPFSAFGALFCLCELGKLKSGQKVLINGASGGIGTAAVQLARYYGAEVTGVCSTTNLEMVKSLGADKVIDYTKEDFTKTGQTYDVIFDTVAKSSFSRCKGSLKQKGIYLNTGLGMALLQMLWTSMIGSKKAKILLTGMRPTSEKIKDLLFLKELIEEGKIKSVIDRRYSLEQIAEAHRYVEKGHKKGNVVITLEHNNKT